MKIDGKLTKPPAGNAAQPTPAARSDAPRAGTAAPGESVEVSISGLAGQLQALQAELGAGAPVDAARVAEIRQAIAEGRLRINPEVIADRLLETVRELLEGTPKP